MSEAQPTTKSTFEPVKSMTFWGGLALTLAYFLSAQGLISPNVAAAVESGGGLAALMGIRRRL